MRLRGRKGIRESIESQAGLIVLEAAAMKGEWASWFGNHNPIHVELGMGKGGFITEMSVRNPNINYIGVDMYDELLRRAAEKARLAHDVAEETARIPNLTLALFNVDDVLDVFDNGELDRVFLNFCDPWPKRRHMKRRLTHEGFLQKYQQILKEHGEIHFKTDSRMLFEFSLNSFADAGLRMRNISLDLHHEGLRQDMVQTEYELKFHEQGMPIYRCEILSFS